MVLAYPFAREAVREAIYNAIAHNCYMFGTPIQIRIEEEAMIISNRCILPDGWTVETLMAPHDSIPYNPDIANVFYRAGYIEHWGRGIEKICDACKEIGAEIPRYELRGNGIRVHFAALQSAMIKEGEETKSQIDIIPNLHDVGLAEKIINLIIINPTITMKEMAIQLNVAQRTVEREIKKIKENGRLERVGGKRYGHWQIMD